MVGPPDEGKHRRDVGAVDGELVQPVAVEGDHGLGEDGDTEAPGGEVGNGRRSAGLHRDVWSNAGGGTGAVQHGARGLGPRCAGVRLTGRGCDCSTSLGSSPRLIKSHEPRPGARTGVGDSRATEPET